MTYQELKWELERLTPEQLRMDVTVLDSNMDEYFLVQQGVRFTGEVHDVLDPHHPYFVFSP